MKRTAGVYIAIIIIISCGFLCGCRGIGQESGKEAAVTEKLITVSGSTSVGPLMEILADGYKRDAHDISIEIQQIGSSAGINNAISGVSEIGMSSRDLKADEAEEVTSTPIAYDGIVVITHKDNSIDSLTMEQIKDIYTGRITNWSQIGGNDGTIVVVSREEGSGTRDSFQEIIGYESNELESKALIGDGNGSIKTTVMGNRNAIGYISFEYLDEGVKGIKCGGVSPKAENVINGTYKLSRPFIVVYKEASLNSSAKDFISFILSSAGQNIVEESGNIRAY